MFVAKYNANEPVTIFRATGSRLWPTPRPEPRRTPPPTLQPASRGRRVARTRKIQGVRIACAVAPRTSKRLGDGGDFLTQVPQASLGPNPFNASFEQIEPTLDFDPNATSAFLAITNNPNYTAQPSVGGGGSTAAASSAGSGAGSAIGPTIPGQTVLQNQLGSQSGIGLGSGKGVCIFGRNADLSCKEVPWWFWLGCGVFGLLLIAAVVRR